MSGFEVDSANLKYFAELIDEQIGRFAKPASTQPGSTGIVPPLLSPDPANANPDIGQHDKRFQDAVDLYRSYERYRFQFLGDPSQLGSPDVDPTASSLAAFVSGLLHLSATAKAVAKNYDSAQAEDKFSADQVNAMMDSALSQAATTPPPATGNGTGG